MQQNLNITNINIDSLIPNSYQPRKYFNEQSLNELALSIKQYGIINPILVRQRDNKYEIIAGERRVKAAKKIGLTEVPAIIKNIDDNQMAELALIENLQKEEISAIEEAKTYKQILSLLNVSEEQLGNMIGKSPTTISNKLKLLNLPENIQEALMSKKISEKHAKSLLNVSDINKQTELLNRIISEKLTVKELENIINEKQITEEEMSEAIDEIMSSLKSNKEEKEEKESESMNNENFFPNYNSMEANNINPSLNNGMPGINVPPAVEIGTMNQNTMQPEMPIFGQSLMMTTPDQVANNQPSNPQGMMNFPGASYNIPNMQPMPEQNMVMPQMQPVPNMPVNITPEATAIAEIANQAVTQNTVPVAPVNNVVADIPLFGEQNLGTEIPIQSTPEAQNTSLPTPPANDISIPMFNQEVTQSPKTFENIKNILTTNNIAYKAYSNETGHCIIIEM